MLLHSKNKVLDLSSAKVMGILNVTPDSFSDGGRFGRAKLPDKISFAFALPVLLKDPDVNFWDSNLSPNSAKGVGRDKINPERLP